MYRTWHHGRYPCRRVRAHTTNARLGMMASVKISDRHRRHQVQPAVGTVHMTASTNVGLECADFLYIGREGSEGRVHTDMLLS